jgi:hypothetical protein
MTETSWVEISVSTCSDKLCDNCQHSGTYHISEAEFTINFQKEGCFSWLWTPDGGAASPKVGKFAQVVDLASFSCHTTTEGAGLIDSAQATVPFVFLVLALLASFN